MKHIIPTDRNTFFNVRRENLQSLRHPLKRGNTIPESYKESGMFYDEKAWQPFPKVYGGAGQTADGHSSDKNIFFQTRIRQEPFLRKRIFKDLEPESRVVGKLAITKKERDAENMLKSVGGIGVLLTDFLSTPSLDLSGKPIIDPITNKPVMVKRSLFEVLQVAQSSIFRLFQELDIPVSPTMNTIIKSFSVRDSADILQRAQEVIRSDPNRTIAERSAIVKHAVLNEKLLDESKIDEPALVRAIRAEVLEQKISPGDEKDDAVKLFIRPVDWTAMNLDQKAHVYAYIITREDKTTRELRGLAGNRIDIWTDKPVIGAQFRNRYLNTNTLRFVDRFNVPTNLR